MKYYIEGDRIIDGAVQVYKRNTNLYIFMITWELAGDYIFWRGIN